MQFPKIFAQIGTGLAFSLMFHVTFALAQEARFFRVAGPVPVAITSFTQDGTVTWTNTPTNATFIVQTATDLAASNWVDWVQVPVSSATTTIHRICDPNPPVSMAFIPAGSFMMGSMDSSQGYPDEIPSHAVYVSAFYMERYEVTKVLWDEVRTWAVTNGYAELPVTFARGTNHPVYYVDWSSAIKWCNARSEKEGRVPAYYTDAAQTVVMRSGGGYVPTLWVKWNAGYRLPTEVEWEKAARGGLSGLRFPWGNTISHTQANYRAWQYFSYDLSYPADYHPAYNYGTSPVGSFSPNGYGLYDMIGNVGEWCWDWYFVNYYSSSPAIDPRGATTGQYRAVRGGSWRENADLVRSAFRDANSSDNPEGFRCVLGR